MTGSALLRVKVQLWVVVLFMGIAFLAGTLIGAGEPPTTTRSSEVPTAEVRPPVAGPLTDEQIRAGLPPDHPK